MSMIRTLSAAVLGMGLLFTPMTVQAASKAEVSAQKTHVKSLEKQHKTVVKLTNKFSKKAAKGKSTAKYDAEIAGIVKDELNWLRLNGQSTAPDKDGNEEMPWMASYRDALVGVKDAKNAAETVKNLRDVQGFMAKRIERQTKKLENMG